ncbi:secondary thiamine-phosphate synthase enzyme YjbQ [Anthocerotibacter panamensis]|uniref:secondary thiamine-phosphate synthase enzyme YjbQ n=1 Tax=Anthocerotibacter panamensis TaxID=2857077 RepID=UPI001C40808A|nr:secondary thiamine-phosphate synthase enzyme YjbQ [Anthocerotibacter panamensis]
MPHMQTTLKIPTRPKSLQSISREIAAVVERSGIELGLCVVFLRHTSASLLIQENADPDVLQDLEMFFEKLVPETLPYRHATEGPDDMPSHIRTALTSTSETIPIRAGRLALGTWQGIYVWEHRDHSHLREVVVHIMGEKTGQGA